VKIEDGCENRCAYCAIPGARGNVRSKPLPAVVEEVRNLVANGCREVVLTGIETASYGRDTDTSLMDLLEAVDAIEGLERMRLGSLYPTLITEDFAYRLGTLSHLAPHFHLSVQSGSTPVLKAMNRRYTAEEAVAAMERLRRTVPDAEFTADFIVGFPGESDAQFAETLAFVKKANFLQIHVFSYSRRKGTAAAAMAGQIPQAVKKARSAALIAQGRDCRRQRLQSAFANPHRSVLFETYENGLATGHTDNFLEVAVPTDHPLHGELHRVRLLSATENCLLAELED
jgi:threonylcarbamoyladenosine tRNA methylthiotransferase MtaB